MLNPRVVNFKPAPVNVTFKRGNITEDQHVINQTIKNHFFNYSVSIVLPDSMVMPSNLVHSLTNDSAYYKLMSVPLHLFITQDFIDYFVKGGEVTALSVNTWLDCDNCIAITPHGFLILNIDTRTFQELGLVKGPAIDFRKNKNNTYAVRINLNTKCFKIGCKNYEKAYRNLFNNSNVRFDLILTWEPSDIKVCPSSIANFFVRHEIEVKECQVEETKRINYSVKFPLLSAEEEELIEWFGALAFDITGTVPEQSEDFMIFEPPEPYEEIGQVILTSWTGLFSRNRLTSFYEEIRKLASDLKEVPWIGMSVLGYLDTPVSWGLSPHAFRISGENDYTILLNHEEKYLMCMNTETCSAK